VVEFDLGDDDELVAEVILHIRGGYHIVPRILELGSRLDCDAIDLARDAVLTADEDPARGMYWREAHDRMVGAALSDAALDDLHAASRREQQHARLLIGSAVRPLRPSSSEALTKFRRVARQHGVPADLIAQLVEFYHVADGFKAVNGLVILPCDDPNLFAGLGPGELRLGSLGAVTLYVAHRQFVCESITMSGRETRSYPDMAAFLAAVTADTPTTVTSNDSDRPVTTSAGRSDALERLRRIRRETIASTGQRSTTPEAGGAQAEAPTNQRRFRGQAPDDWRDLPAEAAGVGSGVPGVGSGTGSGDAPGEATPSGQPPKRTFSNRPPRSQPWFSTAKDGVLDEPLAPAPRPIVPVRSVPSMIEEAHRTEEALLRLIDRGDTSANARIDAVSESGPAPEPDAVVKPDTVLKPAPALDAVSMPGAGADVKPSSNSASAKPGALVMSDPVATPETVPQLDSVVTPDIAQLDAIAQPGTVPDATQSMIATSAKPVVSDAPAAVASPEKAPPSQAPVIAEAVAESSPVIAEVVAESSRVIAEVDAEPSPVVADVIAEFSLRSAVVPAPPYLDDSDDPDADTDGPLGDPKRAVPTMSGRLRHLLRRSVVEGAV
jgi:hypothetical protein